MRILSIQAQSEIEITHSVFRRNTRMATRSRNFDTGIEATLLSNSEYGEYATILIAEPP